MSIDNFSSKIEECISLNSECLSLTRRFSSMVGYISDSEIEYIRLKGLSYFPLSPSALISSSSPYKSFDPLNTEKSEFYVLHQIGEKKREYIEDLGRCFDEFSNPLKTTLPSYTFHDLEEDIHVYKLLSKKKGIRLVNELRDGLVKVKEALEKRISNIEESIGIGAQALKVLNLTESKKEIYFKFKSEPYLKSFGLHFEIDFEHPRALLLVEELKSLIERHFELKVDLDPEGKKIKNNLEKEEEEEMFLKREFERGLKIREIVDEQNKISLFLQTSEIAQTQENKELLYNWIKEENIVPNEKINKALNSELLWKGSRDGFSSLVFHERCDEKGPTLVLVRANDKNFGGFSFLPWKSTGKWMFDNERKSFLFSIEKKQKLKQKKNITSSTIKRNTYSYMVNSPNLEDANGEKTIYCGKQYGPSFGGGDDLYISSESNLNRRSFSKLGFSYNLPKDIYFGETSSFSYLCGSKHFNVQEIEVWSVS